MEVLWWAKKKVHRSFCVVFLTIGIIFGVLLSFVFDISIFGASVWLVLALALFAVVLVVSSRWTMVFAVIVGAILGVWRAGLDLRDLDMISGFYGKTVAVSGAVFEDPDIKEDGGLSMRLNSLSVDEIKTTGNLYVTASKNSDVKRGDSVKVSGKLGEGFGSFVGSMYRVEIEEVVRPDPGDVMGRVRDWFADKIKEEVPEPEVSLGLGYLLGQRRSLPGYLVEILAITGLTHIVVASGYNLTVLVRFARRLFGRISRFAALFFALLLVGAFVMITGASPSMVRAGLVSVVSLVAWYYGRKTHPVKLLLLVAATTLLISPFYIIDLGWQLSFGAFVGVMILAPILTAYFYGDEKPNFLAQVLVETLAAQICTLPILIYCFGQFSILSLVANVLVLPTIPYVMLTTFMTGISVVMLPFLAGIFGWMATMILRLNLLVMNFFGEISWGFVEIDIGLIGVLVFYVVIIGAGVYMKKVSGYKLMNADVIE